MAAADQHFCQFCGKEIRADSAFCPYCGKPVYPSAAAQGARQASMSGFDALLREPAVQNYWIRRLVAFVIDAILVTIVVAILGLVVAAPYLFFIGITGFSVIFNGLFSVVTGVIIFLYFIFAETYAGGTLGKRVIGLDVVAAGGKSPNLEEAVVRNISKVYWLLLLLDVIVGLAISKGYTQKYTDTLARTDVVESVSRTM